MPQEPTEPRICCPACDYSLDEAEQLLGVCADCGAVLDLDALQTRKEELAQKDARDRRTIRNWRIGAVLGAIMLLVGLILTGTGVSVGLRMRMGTLPTAAALIVGVVCHIREREPLGPLLLLLGITWLAIGLLSCWDP